ncbi:ABC-type multidrug transport system, ATPase component [Halovenus aranensis]|uniref:ABC-type multidrug transport system, ATPase component n=1 Tax=Halovenus aranensis TaxID=890420 RepID=A0A1G8ZIH1_9EURY|nr:ABC transporter ATP-binding protein [Halovenus aranensis]SDK14899.1 ABC-type multidrug transport system, ATPase component [Halovenus aranensis]
MSDEHVLSADDISHSFGGVEVLEAISLSVERGSVTALVGPNGSGKTTLLRVLAGILSPTEGTVSYHGPEAEREIGYMPQQPSFRPGFTAAETLAFYTSLVDGDPESLLDRVGLAQARNRRVEALSGGMRRLLGIAQATVGDPPVTILDEPGSGLDPGMRQQTFEVVANLASEGTAVLLSTHDMTLAAEFADQIALIERGAVVETGTPQQLLDTYECESLQTLFETAFETDTAVDVAGETA